MRSGGDAASVRVAGTDDVSSKSVPVVPVVPGASVVAGSGDVTKDVVSHGEILLLQALLALLESHSMTSPNARRDSRKRVRLGKFWKLGMMDAMPFALRQDNYHRSVQLTSGVLADAVPVWIGAIERGNKGREGHSGRGAMEGREGGTRPQITERSFSGL